MLEVLGVERGDGGERLLILVQFVTNFLSLTCK